jgi:hypothetical protein
MERTLRRQYPEVSTFPLVRTLAAAAWELQVSQRMLLSTLKNPRKTLWYRCGRVYVPPDVYERWRQTIPRS